jgi:uncharacterized membrane protein
MEIFLLIALIIVFLITMNSLSRKIDTMRDGFYELSRKLDQYRKLAETAAEKPAAQAPPPTAWPNEQPRPEAPAPIPAPVTPIADKPATPVYTPPKPEAPKPEILTPADAGPRVVINAPARPVQQASPQVPQPPRKSWWENFKEQNPDLEKFIGENLINKIGMLMLVLGISYFVKYAIDKDWIGEPARVGVGILAGGIVMLVAHRLRINYKAFSSVLVAGAIAIFYFTITVAFHDYHLFGQTTAFIIMVGITAFSAFISVNYNRQELAVLSLIGGFAAPFMVSTGAGNYVVLFTYIAILNVGILLVAYYKKWSIVNVVAFIFTVALYGAWLYDTDEVPYTGALAFAFVFYLIFIVMNIINNIRTKLAFTNRELTILVSNTFLFYGAGMYILDAYLPQYKGMFTLLLGAFNFIFAWLLYKKLAMDQKIIYILIGLTLTFVTLAIPIQFEGNYITLFWAAEAVLLMWLAQKSGIQNFRLGSAIVHALMLISLLMDWVQLYSGYDTLTPVINPAFLTGLFAISSCIGIVLLLRRDTENYSVYGITFNVKNYSSFVKIITLALLYVTGFLELYYQGDAYLESSLAVYSLLVLYHLILSAIFIQAHCIGKSQERKQLGAVIGILNAVAFILLFSRLAYYEVEHYLEYLIKSRLGYWLHFALIAVVGYTLFIVYKNNRDGAKRLLADKGFLPWVAVFLLVYFASSELMLHWLVISLDQIKLAGLPDGGYNVAMANSINIVRAQAVKTGYPVLWGVIAGLVLYTGIKKQMKNIRIVGLVLLGLTIAKLFIYDIRNSETGKIIAFILLAVLTLIISFVYQKLKLVIADKPAPETVSDAEPNSLPNQTDETI